MGAFEFFKNFHSKGQQNIAFCCPFPFILPFLCDILRGGGQKLKIGNKIQVPYRLFMKVKKRDTLYTENQCIDNKKLYSVILSKHYLVGGKEFQLPLYTAIIVITSKRTKIRK